MLSMCANNYLGLGDSPRLIDAAKRTYDEKGLRRCFRAFSSAAPRIFTNSSRRRFPASLGTDDTILYSSCFDAKRRTVRDHPDRRRCRYRRSSCNHALPSSTAYVSARQNGIRYKNNDMADLEAQLKELPTRQARRIKLIATDGVFSMDGIICNLKGVCDLADKYNALVMVDDSHAVGFVR